jgi:hypothetical protein
LAPNSVALSPGALSPLPAPPALESPARLSAAPPSASAFPPPAPSGDALEPERHAPGAPQSPSRPASPAPRAGETPAYVRAAEGARGSGAEEAVRSKGDVLSALAVAIPAAEPAPPSGSPRPAVEVAKDAPVAVSRPTDQGDRADLPPAQGSARPYSDERATPDRAAPAALSRQTVAPPTRAPVAEAALIGAPVDAPPGAETAAAPSAADAPGAVSPGSPSTPVLASARSASPAPGGPDPRATEGPAASEGPAPEDAARTPRSSGTVFAPQSPTTAPSQPVIAAPPAPDAEQTATDPAGSAEVARAAPAPAAPLPGPLAVQSRRAAAAPAPADAAAPLAGPSAETAARAEATAAQPADPGAPAAPARQIAQAIVAAGADGRVEVRLDPPELGAVGIDIRFEEGGVSATVTAERPETLELIRRNVEALQRDLAAAGFARADVSFGDRGFAEGRRDAPQPEARPAAEPAREAPPTVPPRRDWLSAGPRDRLDIRL